MKESWVWERRVREQCQREKRDSSVEEQRVRGEREREREEQRACV